MSSALKDHLLRYYETAFPSRDKVSIRDVTPIGDGWETEVFSFTLEYRDAAAHRREDLILRVYPGSDAREKSAREFGVMKRLHGLGYPVPQVFALQQDESHMAKPFVIMERIAGPSLGAAYEAASEQERRELLGLFCRLFVELHSLDWRQFAPDVSCAAPPVSESAVGRMLVQGRGHIEASKRREFAPALDWLVRHAAETGPERLALVHWDFHPWNILVKDDGSPFVIDWGSAEVTDFRFDLAWTLVLAGTYGYPELRDLVLDGYKQAATCHVEQIGYFEAAACLRRLFTIAVSVTEGAETMGMRPGAERAMLGDSEHLRAIQDLLCDRTGLVIPQIDDLLGRES